MSKKVLPIIALFLVSFVSPCFALSEEAFYKKLDVITLEVYKLASDILAFNQPAFETKLTKKEQTNGVLWNRVCAKDQTLVWGYAKKDKKFTPIYFVTNDPKFTFTGGVRVGADVKVLERYFGDKIENIGITGWKTIRIGPEIEATDFIPASVHIICANGVITEIIFNGEEDLLEGGDAAFSKEAIKFKDKKAKEMGLSPNVNAPEELTPEEQAQKETAEKKALQAEFQNILRKAEASDAEAQAELGDIYWLGTHGVAVNNEKALYWLKKAAAQNDTNAMSSLGKIYRNGFAGVKKDDKEADYWFDKFQKTIQEQQKRNFKANPASTANGVIAGDKVNIRSKPNTSSKVVAQLNKGHLVLVTEQTKAKDGYWYFIETANGIQGWVFGKYLRGR